jgi:hypothetical protein
MLIVIRSKYSNGFHGFMSCTGDGPVFTAFGHDMAK